MSAAEVHDGEEAGEKEGRDAGAGSHALSSRWRMGGKKRYI